MTKGQMAQEKIHSPIRKWNPSFTKESQIKNFSGPMGSTFFIKAFKNLL
jgi:hypothetical protein